MKKEICQKSSSQPFRVYQPGGSIVQPGLAESWSVSTNGLTWTFQLRAGGLNSNPVGSGPFKFGLWMPGDTITLTGNGVPSAGIWNEFPQLAAGVLVVDGITADAGKIDT